MGTVLSVSRRTDIPAYYFQWFLNRLKEGYVLARNPFNPRQVRRIDLSEHLVDGIVFWTKNPLALLSALDRLRGYTYYVQYTLTPYEQDVEPRVPSKEKVLLPTLQRLSERIGPERVIWRYDPIFLNDKITFDYHLERFAHMATRLRGYTQRCVISFLDVYPKIERNMREARMMVPTESEQRRMAYHMGEIATQNNLELYTCAERIDLSAYGIKHAACVDAQLLERLSGRSLNSKKDPNQRPGCGCAASVDIGQYNTCMNGCRYCYANYSAALTERRAGEHDPRGELLFGRLGPHDVVREGRP